MRHLTRFVLACAAMASVGCYSDRLPPPNFRYTCSVDGDCDEPESCIRGLCQIACTQATFRDDCPSAGSYVACFNGACSNVCTLGAGHCPDPLACVELPIDVAAVSQAFGSVPSSDDPLGLCGVECQPGDDVCPDGEQCFQGFCIQSCMFDAECQQGFACIAGLCIPEEAIDADTADTADTGEGGAEATTGGPQ